MPYDTHQFFFHFTFADNNVIIWYKQKQQITQEKHIIANDARVSVDANYSLKINNVRESDASEYFCNILPHNISMKADLEVPSAPTAKIFDKENRDISNRQMTYHQGQRIEIECRGYGSPTPQIKWFTKGERVHSGVNNVHVNNGHLIIDNADHDHVKVYQCLADNGVGVGHTSFTVNVHCAYRKHSIFCVCRRLLKGFFYEF